MHRAQDGRRPHLPVHHICSPGTQDSRGLSGTGLLANARQELLQLAGGLVCTLFQGGNKPVQPPVFLHVGWGGMDPSLPLEVTELMLFARLHSYSPPSVTVLSPRLCAGVVSSPLPLRRGHGLPTGGLTGALWRRGRFHEHLRIGPIRKSAVAQDCPALPRAHRRECGLLAEEVSSGNVEDVWLKMALEKGEQMRGRSVSEGRHWAFVERAGVESRLSWFPQRLKWESRTARRRQEP